MQIAIDSTPLFDIRFHQGRNRISCYLLDRKSWPGPALLYVLKANGGLPLAFFFDRTKGDLPCHLSAILPNVS
jgi:hypothetical protein